MAVRRFLRATLLAFLLAATGLGVAEEPVAPPSNIVTCSTGVPLYLDCAYERINWSLLGFEAGAGARIVIDKQNESLANVTPFLVIGSYQERHAWWVEFTTPEGIVPLIGDDPQMVTVGGEYRW